jgi:hypothetical protein
VYRYNPEAPEDGITSLPSNISGRVFLLVTVLNNSSQMETGMREEIGTITNGKLNFTLPDIPTAIVNKGVKLADAFTRSDVYTVTSSTVSRNPADAKILYTAIEVEIDNMYECPLYYEYEITTTSDPVRTYNGQNMIYVYLDKPATVSGELNATRTNSSTGNTVTYQDTYRCNFTKGWNTFYSAENDTMDSSTSTYSSTSTMSTDSSSVSIANMKWVLHMN